MKRMKTRPTAERHCRKEMRRANTMQFVHVRKLFKATNSAHSHIGEKRKEKCKKKQRGKENASKQKSVLLKWNTCDVSRTFFSQLNYDFSLSVFSSSSHRTIRVCAVCVCVCVSGERGVPTFCRSACAPPSMRVCVCSANTEKRNCESSVAYVEWTWYEIWVLQYRCHSARAFRCEYILIFNFVSNCFFVAAVVVVANHWDSKWRHALNGLFFPGSHSLTCSHALSAHSSNLSSWKYRFRRHFGRFRFSKMNFHLHFPDVQKDISYVCGMHMSVGRTKQKNEKTEKTKKWKTAVFCWFQIHECLFFNRLHLYLSYS